MKKRQKKLFGILLTCLMVCLPVSEALAATSYDAVTLADTQTLFPNDSLINLTTVVMPDGTEVAPEGGVWTNTEEGIAYKAAYAEDGRLSLTQAGYILEVEGGTSAKNDESSNSMANHKLASDEENAGKAVDIAYYQSGETVKLKADEAAEGMEFAGWTCATEGVSISDPSSTDTTFTMPEKKVTVKANYQEAQQTVDEPDGEGASADPAQDGSDVPEDSGVQEDPDVVIDPDAQNVADVTIDLDGQGELDDTVDLEAPENPEQGNNAPASYNVTVNDGSGAGSYAAGDTVSVTANDYSADGYQFTSWSVDSLNAELSDLYAASASFVMPEGEVVLTAHYNEVQTPVLYGVTVNNGVINDETGAVSYEAGAHVNVVANDRTAEGLAFNNWTIDSGNTALDDASAASTGFTMPEGDVVVTANYTEIVPETPQPETPQSETPQSETAGPTYDVLVENGLGSGTYAAGETVTVEAQAEEGMVFQSWQASSGDVVLADPTQEVTTFTMPEEGVTVKAEYAAEAPAVEETKYNVTVQNGVTEASAYAANAVVTVTAEQTLNGQTFDHWEGTANLSGTAAPISFADAKSLTTTFTMPAGEVTVTAVYKTLYTVTVANGVITDSAGQPLSNPVTLEDGAQITVTANPNPAGQIFSMWRVNDGTYDLGDSAYNSSVTVSVAQNMNFVPVYEGIQYDIIVNDGSSNYGETVSGTVVTITADEAPEGMEFDYWKVDSGNVALADAYSSTTTFTMPEGDVTVSAAYKLKEYKLVVENGNSSQQYYHMGDVVTVSSNYPASGKEFNQWTATSGNVSFKDSSRWQTTFTMPASDVTVKATYKDGPSTNDNLIQDIVAGGEYYTGDTIKFTASGAGMGNSNPNPGDYRYRPAGYQIGNVTGNWQSSPYTTSMAIKATGEYTLKVNYNKEVFDGNSWVSDGTSDTKSVTFRVITKAAGVATGDETPVMLVAAIAVISCVLFILLLIIFLKKRRNKK